MLLTKSPEKLSRVNAMNRDLFASHRFGLDL